MYRIFIAALALFCLSAAPALCSQPLLFSCMQPTTIYLDQNSYCNMVQWTSASIYNVTSAEAIYYEHSKPLSMSFQDSYASDLAGFILSRNGLSHKSSLCSSAIKRYAHRSKAIYQSIVHFKSASLRSGLVALLLSHRVPPADRAQAPPTLSPAERSACRCRRCAAHTSSH